MAEPEDLCPPKMMISDEELAAERIPLAARDCCAHLLVDLNRCKRRNAYLPFRCTQEKHDYEQCLYKDFIRRTKVLQKIKESEGKK